MSIYEEKMPSYLAMSRGDLIAEILSAADECDKWLKDHIARDHQTRPSPAVDAAVERIRIANDVLDERFGLIIEVDALLHRHDEAA